MLWRSIASRIADVLQAAVLAGAVLVAAPQAANAQVNNNAGEQTPDTIGAPNLGLLSGVAIDADGVLRTKVIQDPTGQLIRQRLAQAKAALPADVATPSKLRKVSLNRLEAALKQRLEEGRRPNEEMLHLAGLTRLRYVFFYPGSGDIVIAGPAEGWGEVMEGRPVGLVSGRPVLELQDLVVALRTFAPGASRANNGAVFCSIDPTQEGLAKMQQFLRQIGGRATPRDTQFIVQGLRNSLGWQQISIGGVAPNTHFAQVMVEADYRMKLIGIGLEMPPVKLVSYVARVNPAQVARNAMQRWYFVPNYECVRVAGDELAMELVGDGVKLVGEDEVVRPDGARQQAGTGNRASQQFVQGFTKAYPQLAQKSPVYAQLRNLIDMLVAAAFMESHGYYDKAGWRMEVLGNEAVYPVETHNAPQKVASAVNSLWRGNTLMTPIGGGVMIEPRRALASESLLGDEDGKLQALHNEVDLSTLPKGSWWWD